MEFTSVQEPHEEVFEEGLQSLCFGGGMSDIGARIYDVFVCLSYCHGATGSSMPVGATRHACYSVKEHVSVWQRHLKTLFMFYDNNFSV